MSSPPSLWREGLRVSGKIVRPIIGFTLLGSFISVALFFVGIGPASSHCGVSETSSVWGCLWGLLFLVVYLMGAPILYFFIAKTYGVLAGIHYVVSTRQAFIWRYVLKQQFKRMERDGLLDTDGNVSGGEQFMAYTKQYIKTLPGVPWALRQVLRAILFLVPFHDALAETLTEIRAETQGRAMSSEEVAERLTPRLADEATRLAFDPTPLWFWLVVGGQTLLVVLLRVL